MKSRKKILFVSLKLLLAATLLAWVISGVHWHDYAQGLDGKTYAVLGSSGQGTAIHLNVAWGRPWDRQESVKPLSQFRSVRAGNENLPASSVVDAVHPGFAASMRNMNILLLVLAMLGFLFSWLVVAVRWWFLLKIQDIFLGLWEVIRLTFLGQFFNLVVPGTVGGDLVKAYYVSKHASGKAAAVLVSIFVDRVMGLAELTLLAGVMVLTVWLGGLAPMSTIREPAITVAAVVGVVVLAMVFLLSAKFRSLFHLEKLYSRLPIAHQFAAAGNAAALYRRRLGALARAIAITFGAHVFWIGSVAMLGKSLFLDTPWYSYFLYIPLIYILGSVPLTPGGIGLVEKLYLVFFAGVNPSSVLALALLARLVPIFWSLPGLLVAIAGPKVPRTQAMEAELGLDKSAPPS